MKLSPFKVFFVVSLLAGFSAAAPMETSETVSEVIPAPESSPVVSLPPVTGTGEEKEEEEEGGEMHILPIDEEQEEESDTVHILPLEPIVPIEEPTTEDTTDGTVSILPLDPIVPMLILDSTEAIADCRAKVVAEFKRPFNLLLRQITANLTGFNGPRTFFKADKYSYFILQSEVAIVKSNLPPYIDYEAYDLQTGELVTMRTREKYEADGSDIKDEVVCNGVMGSLVHDYFKVRMWPSTVRRGWQ